MKVSEMEHPGLGPWHSIRCPSDVLLHKLSSSRLKHLRPVAEWMRAAMLIAKTKFRKLFILIVEPEMHNDFELLHKLLLSVRKK